MTRLEGIGKLGAIATLALAGAACGTTVNNNYYGETPMPSSAAGQPTPDATPSFQVVATETPTAKPSVAPYNDHELKPGESITVTGSALVQGDVVVDGKILYDNRSETGLIVEINGGTHTITAPFGADVQEFGTKVDSEVFASTEGTDVELMKEKGCGLPTGCEKVIIDKVN